MSNAAAPVRWGLIGASTIAGDHVVDAIRSDPGSEMIAVTSSNRNRGEAFARTHGIPVAYERIDDLLADESLDAVYISTTNDRHRDETIAAAAAGKHVLCEKPLALTVTDAGAMRRACETAGVVLGVNHHLRCAPAHRTVRRLLADGTIGRVLAARVFHAMYLDPRLQTWRITDSARGAGVVLDLTVHDADLLRFVLADEVEHVIAFAARQGMAAGTIEDSVMGVMRFTDGALASFHDAFTVPDAGTGLEIHGTTGSIIVQDAMVSVPTAQVFLRRGPKVERVDVGDADGLHSRAIRQFAQAVRGLGPPAATGEDGERSVAIACAVLESATSGIAVQPTTWDIIESRSRPATSGDIVGASPPMSARRA